MALAAMLGQGAFAANITWNTGSGTFTNGPSWVGGVAPGAADNAVFNSASITGNPNINVNANPIATVQVGSLTAGSSILSNFRITANSAAANPTTLNLNGVGGILISNYSPNFQVILTNASAAPGTALNIGLGANGVIYAANGAGTTPPKDASGGEIVVYSAITGTGSFTNVGPGILDVNAVNTYSGSTTLAAGSLEVGGTATLGTGTLYLSGGNLESGGSRTTAIANNIVLTATSYIFSEVASANSTRIFPLSGTLGGSAGTLIIANPNTAANEIFQVQLLGSFVFNQPLVDGDNLGDAFNDDTFNNTYGEVELANSTATGPQTFNGIISGDGPIVRASLTSSVGGISTFTAANTYTGGTFINSGTIFANNTTGSALGTAAVTVTNQGTLAGNGIVGAPTTIYLNGTVQPGATATSVGNLSVNSGLTFAPGSKYTWQISSATGTPGTAWDLITAGGGWTDGVSGGSVATINITSGGLTPTGWNDATSYQWIIISNNGWGTGFNASDWAVNTTGFSGPLAGVFGVTTNPNGDLVLTYTPAAGNYLIDVESGSVAQGGVSPTPYPVLTGLFSVTKVGNGEVIMTNSANSYQGQTFIDAGTVSAAVNSTTSGGALGASTTPILLGNTAGNSNATLNIDQPGVSIANAITVQAGSTGVKTIGTTIPSGVATNSGNVTLNDNVTLSAAAGSTGYFLGNFSGAGGITLTGGGTFVLGGVGSYSGPTTLSSGSLDIDGNALGTNTFTIGTPTVLDNTSGGSVTLANNPPETWNDSFAFGGSANLNLGAGPVFMNANITVTVSNSVLTVGGPIAGTGVGLTIVGPGEVALTAVTNSTYNGGTTNVAAIVAINATSTFGDGTGTLVFAGGAGTTNYLLNTGTRLTLSVSNPVQINTPLRLYGNSTDTTSPNRYLPFLGGFTVNNSSTIYVDNIGSAKTIFNLTLEGSNYTTIAWPIVIGDPNFDTAGALTTLNLANDNTTPVQTISSLITGTGSLIRGANVLNTGGTTILTAQNTFSGGAQLNSGALGLGASSVLSGGSIVSGPIGTGQFTLGASTSETNLTIFAVGGPIEIDNKIFINGDTNITFAGTNNILFTSDINSGGVAKTLAVTNGVTVTFSGAITNTGSSGGGSLTKTGGGTLIFTGTSTYAGTTTVRGGLLLVNGVIGTNNVTANSGGTFGGIGTAGGNVTFAGSSETYLFKSAGSPDSPFTVASNLTLNANTVVVDLGGTTTLGPGTYNLLNYGGALSGSFNAAPVIANGSLAAGYTGTIDLSTPGQVNLIVAVGSSTPPLFTSESASGGNIVFGGSGGTANQSYVVYTSTNLAVPLSAWTPVVTNNFDGSGNFRYTNAMSATGQQFFIIK